MRKDGAFRIYEISYKIHPRKCRYGGVKDKNLRNYNFIFHTCYQTLKWVKTACDAHYITAGTFLCIRGPVSALYVQQFQSTSINPEKCPKTTISGREGP